VPVKFGLLDDPQPGGYDTSAWTIARQRVSCENFDVVDAELEVGSKTPSTVFRYDATSDQYVYNADFGDAASGTCWKVIVDLHDGGPTLVSAIFKIGR
jgi:hypothetical protein